MTTAPSPTGVIPELRKQPLAVDFIDNRMAAIHPAFAHPSTCYQPETMQYVSISQEVASPHPSAEPQGIIPGSICGMKFWDSIFAKSMDAFRTEYRVPDGKARTHCIRDKTSWSEIYAELQSAKSIYTGSGATHRFRNKLASFCDSTQGVDAAVQVFEKLESGGLSVPVVSPIWAVVKLVLNVRVFLFSAFKPYDHPY